MKRFTILAALIALVGCSQYSEELDKIAAPIQKQTEFHASMPECDTRTYVEDNKYLRWNAGDEITVFNGNSYNSHWKFAGEDGANSGKFNEINEGGFVTGSPLELTANYAIYPYDENITITEAGVVSLTLPAVQEYNHTYANSFGEGANTMMAVTKNSSDNFLAFKNLCGYLKLKFYGDDVTVKSVTIKGNNSEKIAGNATVTMAYGGEPTITMGNDATDTITIDCGEGVELSNDSANPTIFWVVIPETTFEGGITITVTDTNDQTFTKTTTNAVPIVNNMIQPMAALDVECVKPIPKPAKNEIWYTNGSTTSKTTPYKTNAFGAKILSNIYDNQLECWVINFDGEVTEIGDWAFSGCNLTSITIPNSVFSVGEAAFNSCRYMTSVSIPNSVTYIGPAAFYDCGALTSIVIPNSITTIMGNTFSSCTNLRDITMSNNITSIGENAFYGCSNMMNIAIPDGVTFIGEAAFGGCSNLTNITIPNGIKSIQNYTFVSCSSLQIIDIPDSVTSIGDYAFIECHNLEQVTISKNVVSIGKAAFDNCPKLSSVYCKPTTPPTLGSGGVFGHNATDRKIYVPSSSIAVYRVKQYWNNYYSYIVAYDF